MNTFNICKLICIPIIDDRAACKNIFGVISILIIHLSSNIIILKINIRVTDLKKIYIYRVYYMNYRRVCSTYDKEEMKIKTVKKIIH